MVKSTTKKNTRTFRRKKQARRKTGRVRKVMKRKMWGGDEDDLKNGLKGLITEMVNIDKDPKITNDYDKKFEKEYLIQSFFKFIYEKIPSSESVNKKKYILNILNKSINLPEYQKSILYKTGRAIGITKQTNEALFASNIKKLIESVTRFGDNLDNVLSAPGSEEWYWNGNVIGLRK